MIAKMLFNILVSIATEKLFRELLAAGLEQVITHTDTKVDDAMLTPIIKALRGDGDK